MRQTRGDLKPALQQLQGVVNLLLKNQSNLDESLRLMAPFYRVFANTLGNGPWFDTWIANLPPTPSVSAMKLVNKTTALDRGRHRAARAGRGVPRLPARRRRARR